MKQLLVFLFSLLILSGCTCADNESFKGRVIMSIESKDNGICKYVFSRIGRSFDTDNFSWFTDSCGKYQIGDTLKLTK